jgi:nucleoporin p58/p45
LSTAQQVLAQSGQPLFTKSTKFNDLPDYVKKTFEDIEYASQCSDRTIILISFRTHIQGRVQISKDLKQRKVGEEATKGQDSIRKAHKVSCFSRIVSHAERSHQNLINSITVLQNDILNTRDLKAKVDQSVQDTIVAVHIIDGFRNPQQHGTYLRNHANFPLE